MEYLTMICENLIMGYGGATALFLLISRWYTPLREIKSRYLSVSNLAAMVISLVQTADIIKNYLSDVLKYADYTFLQYSLRYIIVILFCTSVLPLCFLFKKLRTNITFTLLVAILMIAASWYRVMYFIVFYSFGDQHTSSWSYYRSSYLEMLCWPLGYFFAALLLTRIKRAIPKRG